MQRGILDTNVIIAVLISRGVPHLILTESFIENNIQLCVSDKLLEEYFDVLNRPKFTKYADFVLNTALFLIEIQRIAMRFEPKIKLNLISDIDDNMILEPADKCNADFIINANSNDFKSSQYKDTQ
jgi:hypothetical protein